MNTSDSAVPARIPPKDVARCCRFCGVELRNTLLDLGATPLCQEHIRADQFDAPERYYPLRVRVCEACFLVQIDDVVPPEELFNADYAYYSSYSDSWLEHARRYAEAVIARFDLTAASTVMEVGSNDGYMLRHFLERGVGVLGIEPALRVADAARARGIPTIHKFFGLETACAVRREQGGADLLIGNNVLAHVPDINDFVAGLTHLLAPGGVLTMEFPHLLRLIEGNQFDTIYHEHHSYLSLTTVERIFAVHGLELFDVEELSTHGGSLRVYARHAGSGWDPPDQRVCALREVERHTGLTDMDYYRKFPARVEETKIKLLEFLIAARARGDSVVGYGAPGKGNTLLNYCGIGPDLIEYTVDRNPVKQGGLLPGSRIPIHEPDRIRQTRPDYVVILPWNLREEIMGSMAGIREWGGRFVVPIPEVTVYE